MSLGLGFYYFCYFFGEVWAQITSTEEVLFVNLGLELFTLVGLLLGAAPLFYGPRLTVFIRGRAQLLREIIRIEGPKKDPNRILFGKY